MARGVPIGCVSRDDGVLPVRGDFEAIAAEGDLEARLEERTRGVTAERGEAVG